jgi:hypothetical protein
MRVIFYDKYYDIPTRGIISLEKQHVAFTAEVDQDANDERWAKGIPATVFIFPGASELEHDFEFINKKFKKWKVEGFIGVHPLLADIEYQAAVNRIDECFGKFSTYNQRVSGLFSNDGESWNFEPILPD